MVCLERRFSVCCGGSVCFDFWHKAIGLKLAMLKQFESDQGRLKARSSSQHRLREKAGDIWWRLTLTGYRCFGYVSGEAASSQPDAWKILEDLGRFAMAVGGQQVAVLLSLCIFCGFRWFRLWLCTGLLMFVASRWRVSDSRQAKGQISRSQEVGAFPGCTRHFQGPGRGEVFGWRAGSQTRTGRGETWWNMVRHGETWGIWGHRHSTGGIWWADL